MTEKSSLTVLDESHPGSKEKPGADFTGKNRLKASAFYPSWILSSTRKHSHLTLPGTSHFRSLQPLRTKKHLYIPTFINWLVSTQVLLCFFLMHKSHLPSRLGIPKLRCCVYASSFSSWTQNSAQSRYSIAVDQLTAWSLLRSTPQCSPSSCSQPGPQTSPPSCGSDPLMPT